jgi:hypothetical protein
MVTTQSYLMNLSASSLSALRWARAAAAHRTAGVPSGWPTAERNLTSGGR